MGQSGAMSHPPVRPADVSPRQPPLRRVTANVLTDLGWLSGVFNLPPHQSLIDFLAPGVQVIKFTGVRLGRTTPREVACLLPSGRLRGTLEVLVNVRVSDFLRQQASLIVMRRCILAPYGEPLESPKARQLGTVVVNLASAIGVAEWEWSG